MEKRARDNRNKLHFNTFLYSRDQVRQLDTMLNKLHFLSIHCVVHKFTIPDYCIFRRSAISFLLPLVFLFIFLFIFERFFLNCRIVITYWNAHTRNQHFVSGKILRCSPFYARKNFLAFFCCFFLPSFLLVENMQSKNWLLI